MIKYKVGRGKKYGLHAYGQGGALVWAGKITKAFDGLLADVEVLPKGANKVADCSEVRFLSRNKSGIDILDKGTSLETEGPPSEEELKSIEEGKFRLRKSLDPDLDGEKVLASAFVMPLWPEEKEFYRRCIDPTTGESKLVILWGIYLTGNEGLEREGIEEPEGGIDAPPIGGSGGEGKEKNGGNEIIDDPPLPRLKFVLWLLVVVALLAMVLFGIKSCSPKSIDSETSDEIVGISESNDVSGVVEATNDLGGVIVDRPGVLGELGGALVDTNDILHPEETEKVEESGGDPPVVFVEDDFAEEGDGSSDVPVSDSPGRYSLEWVVISGEVDVELPWYGKGLPPVREWPESGFGVNEYNVIVKKDGTKVRDLKVEWLYYESE